MTTSGLGSGQDGLIPGWRSIVVRPQVASAGEEHEEDDETDQRDEEEKEPPPAPTGAREI